MSKDKGSIVAAGLSVVLLCAILYGCYWIAKTVSYNLFYEDMVEQTVRDMVKPGVLK